jgi:hypothetical protein
MNIAVADSLSLDSGTVLLSSNTLRTNSPWLLY